MAGKRKKVDLSAMTPEERAAYEARRAAAAAPRDAYLVYSVDEGGNLTIHTATRDANEVLKQTAGQVEKKYAAFKIK